LFTLVIANKLFESQFGYYEIYEITDYKTIITFFLKGLFLAPLCIFIIVHYGLLILSRLLVESLINLIIRFLKRKFAVKYNEPILIKLYTLFLKKKDSTGNLDYIIDELHKLNLLNFKFILVLTIFSNINGWIFGATLLFLSVIILSLWITFLFLKLIEEGLKLYLRNKNQSLEKVDLLEKN